MTTRRAFLAGLGTLVAAPAVIRTPGLLMPVKRLSLNALVIDDPVLWSRHSWAGFLQPGIHGGLSRGLSVNELRARMRLPDSEAARQGLADAVVIVTSRLHSDDLLPA